MTSNAVSHIIKELKADKRNQGYTDRSIPPVFQVNPAVKILMIGQAPGRKVQETLIPFDDPSGDRLRSWLGIDKETFYSTEIGILPMDFYYPGKGKSGDLAPRSFIAKEYHPALLEIMNQVDLTLLIGNYAIKYYLKEDRQKNLTETVRHYEDYLPEYFPLVHPSPLNFRWHKKNPWFEKEIVPALQEKVGHILGK